MLLTAFALLLVLAAGSGNVRGAEGDEIWSETYGGGEADRGRYVQETSDGGFIITGDTSSYGEGQLDVWLVKTNDTGKKEWDVTFGGTDDDLAYWVQETSDGGFIITGFAGTWGDRTSRDLWLIKTDKDGGEEWSKFFGGSQQEEGRAVVETPDGGFMVTGSTGSYGSGNLDLWLIKTDKDGNEEWNKTHGGGNRDEGHSIRGTSDGGFIIGARTQSKGAGNYDLWLVKIDEDGNIEWDDTWGGSKMDEAKDAIETSDGGFITVGRTVSFASQGTAADLWIIKTDVDGKEEWNQVYGGNQADFGRSVRETASGGFIITGLTKSFGSGDFDCWVVKTDEDGEKEWDQTFGSTARDEGRCVQIAADNSYVLTGETASSGAGKADFWLMTLEGEPVAPGIYVDDDAPDGGDGSWEKPYNKIQDAIDNATEGDTIRVWEGTYEENVVVDKSVSLIGNGSEEVTIDGGENGDVVRITADWVNISGFLVMGSGSDGLDAGIRVESDNTIISNNSCSNNGKGIWPDSSSHCTITDNTCKNNGHGIYLWESGHCTITNNTCNSNIYMGINIRNSNDCTVTNNTCNSNIAFDFSNGIQLDSSNHCTIENNTSQNNEWGIYLQGSSDNTLANNTCLSNNAFGIRLYSSNHCTITNNACTNNYGGIHLEGSSDNTLTNNTCFLNNAHGLSFIQSRDCLLENNTCENSKNAIRLRDSSYFTIENNTMDEDGIYLTGNSLENYNTHTVATTNTVNGKPVYYYKNVTGFTVPSGAGQVILANCTWIKVENQNSSTGSIGVLVGYSSYITHENNTFSNNDYGIYLYSSSNCIISNNTCENNDTGIYLYSSSNCIISNNTCENTGTGIYLWESGHCTITNNKCDNTGTGIYLYTSSDCTITNNICYSNTNYGICLSSSSTCTIKNNTCENNTKSGIFLSFSSDCTLENNTCDNNDNGISLRSSDDNTFVNNTISENRVGIYLASSSRNNTAHYNNIFSNTEYGINASHNDGFTINATFNWWGAASGPYHPAKNLEGKGDYITDYVKFNEKPVARIVSISVSPTLDDIVFTGQGLDDRAVERYVWRSSLDGNLYNGTTPVFPTSGLSLGNHTIYLKVQDDNGAWSEEASKALVIQIHEKPEAEIKAISPSPAFDTDTIEFTGEGADDGTIERYVWSSSLDGELHNSTEANFTNSSLSIGIHTITFKVQDNYGVWSREATASLTVNASVIPNKLPEVTITSPVDGAELKGTVTIKGSASDPDGTVEKVELLVDGEWFLATGTTSWEFQLDTTTLENRDYTINVLAFDGTDYSEDTTLALTVNNTNAGEKGEDDGDDETGFLPGFGLGSILFGMILGPLWLKGKKT